MSLSDIDLRTFVEAQNILDGFDSPDIHNQIIDWLEETQDEPDRLLQVFRGAGKSHLIALYVVWLLIKDPNITIIVMSAKQELARDNARHIRRVIEKNPLAKHLRGEDKWTDFKFFVERTQNTRNASVSCSSIESDNVGMRCDVMIVDDLETDRNSVTEKQREDMRAAIAEFMTIAKRQRTYIGTPHALDSIYTHLMELDYPALRIPWTPEVWANHPDGLFTQEWADRYIAQNPSWKWNSQYLLIPDSPHTALIDGGMIERYSHELVANEVWGPTDAQNTWEVRIGNHTIVDMAAYWDVATGLQGRDRSVLSVVFKDDLNNVYLHRCVILPPVDQESGFQFQCDRVVRECIDLQISRVIVEKSVNLTLHTELKQAAKRKSKWLNVISQPRSRNKTEYIASALEPIVNSKRFYAHVSVPQIFFSELADFPNGKHDDTIDATAGAVDNLRGDVLAMGGAKTIAQQVNATRITGFNTGTKVARFGAQR